MRTPRRYTATLVIEGTPPAALIQEIQALVESSLNHLGNPAGTRLLFWCVEPGVSQYALDQGADPSSW